MNQQDLDDTLERAIRVFQNTPSEHTLAHHQDCTSRFRLLAQEYYTDLALEHIPIISNLPFAECRESFSFMTSIGIYEGACAYASITRPANTQSPKGPQVPFSNVETLIQEIQRAGSHASEAFLAGFTSNECLEYLVYAIAKRVVTTILNRHQELTPHEQVLLELVHDLILLGVRLEYAYTVLIPELETEAWYVEKMHEAALKDPSVAARLQNADESTIMQTLKELNIEHPPHIYPWPSDLQCLCGVDLRPFIFCCDSSELIDVNEITPHFGPEYSFICPKCNTNLPGFNCDRCGRTYTWLQGIVPSLNSLQ